jgi:hypothetical protein
MKHDHLKTFLRLRRYLLLEQIDVSLATGIPVSRISLGERGLIDFNAVERSLLDDFFQMKLRAFGYGSGLLKPNEANLEAANA